MANDETRVLQSEIEENQAIMAYDEREKESESPKVKRTFKDLKEEEMAHKGELLQRAEEVDPKLKEKVQEGREEAKTIKSMKDMLADRDAKKPRQYVQKSGGGTYKMNRIGTVFLGTGKKWNGLMCHHEEPCRDETTGKFKVKEAKQIQGVSVEKKEMDATKNVATIKKNKIKKATVPDIDLMPPGTEGAIGYVTQQEIDEGLYKQEDLGKAKVPHELTEQEINAGREGTRLAALGTPGDLAANATNPKLYPLIVDAIYGSKTNGIYDHELFRNLNVRDPRGETVLNTLKSGWLQSYNQDRYHKQSKKAGEKLYRRMDEDLTSFMNRLMAHVTQIYGKSGKWTVEGSLLDEEVGKEIWRFVFDKIYDLMYEKGYYRPTGAIGGRSKAFRFCPISDPNLDDMLVDFFIENPSPGRDVYVKLCQKIMSMYNEPVKEIIERQGTPNEGKVWDYDYHEDELGMPDNYLSSTSQYIPAHVENVFNKETGAIETTDRTLSASVTPIYTAILPHHINGIVGVAVRQNTLPGETSQSKLQKDINDFITLKMKYQRIWNEKGKDGNTIGAHYSSMGYNLDDVALNSLIESICISLKNSGAATDEEIDDFRDLTRIIHGGKNEYLTNLNDKIQNLDPYPMQNGFGRVASEEPIEEVLKKQDEIIDLIERHADWFSGKSTVSEFRNAGKNIVGELLKRAREESTPEMAEISGEIVEDNLFRGLLKRISEIKTSEGKSAIRVPKETLNVIEAREYAKRGKREFPYVQVLDSAGHPWKKIIFHPTILDNNFESTDSPMTKGSIIRPTIKENDYDIEGNQLFETGNRRIFRGKDGMFWLGDENNTQIPATDFTSGKYVALNNEGVIDGYDDGTGGTTRYIDMEGGKSSHFVRLNVVTKVNPFDEEKKTIVPYYVRADRNTGHPNLYTEEELMGRGKMRPIKDKKFIKSILEQVGGNPGDTASNPLLSGDLFIIGSPSRKIFDDVDPVSGREFFQWTNENFVIVKSIDVMNKDGDIDTVYATVYDPEYANWGMGADITTSMFTKKDLKRYFSGNFSNGGATFDGVSHLNFSRAINGVNEKGENVAFGVEATPRSADELEFTDKSGTPINVHWDDEVKAYVNNKGEIVDPGFAKVRTLKDVRDYDSPSTMNYEAYNAYLDSGFPVKEISDDEAMDLKSKFLEGKKGKNGAWAKFDPRFSSNIPDTKKLDFILFNTYINSRIRDGSIYHEVNGQKIDLKPGPSGKVTIEDAARQLDDEECQKYAEEAWSAVKEVYENAEMNAKLGRSPLATIEDATSGRKRNPSSGKTVEDKNALKLMYVAGKLLKWMYSSPFANDSNDKKSSIYNNTQNQMNIIKGVFPNGAKVDDIEFAFSNKKTKHAKRNVDGSYVVDDNESLGLDDETFEESYMGLEGMGDALENQDMMTPFEQIKSFIRTSGIENIHANRMAPLENVLNKTYDIIKENLYTYWENNDIEVQPGEFDDLFAKALVSELVSSGNEYLFWIPPGIANVFGHNHYLSTKIKENLDELSKDRYYKANPSESRPIDPQYVEGAPEYDAAQRHIKVINGPYNVEENPRIDYNYPSLPAKFFFELKEKMDQGKPLLFVDVLIAGKMMEWLERTSKNTLYKNPHGDLVDNVHSGLVRDDNGILVSRNNKEMDINQVLPEFYAIMKGFEIYTKEGPEEYKRQYDKIYDTYEDRYDKATLAGRISATIEVKEMLKDPYNKEGKLYNVSAPSIKDRLLGAASGYVKQKEQPKVRTGKESASDRTQLGMKYIDERFGRDDTILQEQSRNLKLNEKRRELRDQAFMEEFDRSIDAIEGLRFELYMLRRDFENAMRTSDDRDLQDLSIVGIHGMGALKGIVEKQYMQRIEDCESQLIKEIMNLKKLQEIPQFYPDAFSSDVMDTIRNPDILSDKEWQDQNISKPIESVEDIKSAIEAGEEGDSPQMPATVAQKQGAKKYRLRSFESPNAYYLNGDSNLYGSNGYVTLARELYQKYVEDKTEEKEKVDNKLNAAFNIAITPGMPQTKKKNLINTMINGTKFWQRKRFLKEKYEEYLDEKGVTDKDIELFSAYLGLRKYGAALLKGEVNDDLEDRDLIRLDNAMKRKYPQDPERYTDSPGAVGKRRRFAQDMLYWTLRNPKLFEMITGKKYIGRPFEDSDLVNMRVLDDEQIARRNAYLDGEKQRIKDETLDKKLREYVASYLHLHKIPSEIIDKELGPLTTSQSGETIGVDGLLTTDKANQILNKYGVANVMLPNRDDVYRFEDMMFGKRSEKKVQDKIQKLIKQFSTPSDNGSSWDKYLENHPDLPRDKDWLLGEWAKLPDGENKEKIRKKIERALLPKGTGMSLLDLFNKNNGSNIKVHEITNDRGEKALEMYVKVGDDEYPIDPSKFFNELLPENYDYIDEDGLNISELLRSSIANVKSKGGRRMGMPLELKGRKEQGLTRPISHEERLIYNGQAPRTGSLPEVREIAMANGFTGENLPGDSPLHGDEEWFAHMLVNRLLGSKDKRIDMSDFKSERTNEDRKKETLEEAIANGYKYGDKSHPELTARIDRTVDAIMDERGRKKPNMVGSKNEKKRERKSQRQDWSGRAQVKPKLSTEVIEANIENKDRDEIVRDIMEGTIPIRESAKKRERLIFLMKELSKIKKSNHRGRRDFYINLGTAAKNCTKITKADDFDQTIEDVNRQKELGTGGINIGPGIKPSKIKFKQTKYPWIEKLTGDDMVALRSGRTTPNLEELKKNPQLYNIAINAYGKAEGQVSAKNKRGGPGFFGGQQAMNNNLFTEWVSLMEHEANRQHPAAKIKQQMEKLKDDEVVWRLLQEHEKKGDLADIIREGVLRELGRPFSDSEKLILNRISLNRGLSKNLLSGATPQHNVVPYVPGQFEPERLNRFDLRTTASGYELPDVFRYGGNIVSLNEYDYNTYANLYSGIEDAIIDKARKEGKTEDEIRGLVKPDNIWGKFKLLTHIGDVPVDLTWGPPGTDQYILHYGRIGLGRNFEERDNPMDAAKRNYKYGVVGDGKSVGDDLGDRVDYGGDFDEIDDQE